MFRRGCGPQPGLLYSVLKVSPSSSCSALKNLFFLNFNSLCSQVLSPLWISPEIWVSGATFFWFPHFLLLLFHESTVTAAFFSFLCRLGATKLFRLWFSSVLLRQVIAAYFSVLTVLLPVDHDKHLQWKGKVRSSFPLGFGGIYANQLLLPKPWLSDQIRVTLSRTPSSNQGFFSFTGNNCSDSPDRFFLSTCD